MRPIWRDTRIFVSVAFACLTAAGNPGHAATPHGADFNGDGYGDLAVGAPAANIGVGTVNVFYGSADGIAEVGAQLWHPDSPWIDGAAELKGGYGTTLATGDFDGDGYSDLAIGNPDATVGDKSRAGSVHVLYGSWFGLTAAHNQIWHQDINRVTSTAEKGDNFGASLSSGDFNKDGYADLAIGVPYEDVIAVNDAGAVHVLYGSISGLSASGEQFWHQDIAGVVGTAQLNDIFGFDLTAGDFDCDGAADLVVAVPGEMILGVPYAGAVNVLYGSPGGVTASGNQQWSQGSSGILGIPEEGDQFGGHNVVRGEPGGALATGDFNRDGCADLAIGVPYEGVGEMDGAGGVNVIYGGIVVGLTSDGNQFWHLDTPGVEGVAQKAAWFGVPVVAADFDGDGDDDLAIAGAQQYVNGEYSAGTVNVLQGSKKVGLGTKKSQLWHQDVDGVLDQAEAYDFFAWSLAAGDFDGNGQFDLAIGVPKEDFDGGPDNVGAMHILYGALYGGLGANNDQIWHQGSSSIPGAPSDGEGFGFSAGGK